MISGRTVGSLSEIIVQPTILNRLFIIYNQILSITAIFILAISLKNTPKHYFKQHLLLLVGVMCPIILRLLRFLLAFEIVGFTALSFLPAYMIIYYALFRNQILSIWPVAKDKIFVNMKDGVILTDRSDLIVDLNPTAERILSNLSAVFLDGLHASDSLKDAERLRMLIEAQPLYLPREGLGLGANPS